MVNELLPGANVSRYQDWVDNKFSLADDYLRKLERQEEDRKFIIAKIQNDLATYAASLGQTSVEIENKVDALFNTYAIEWVTYRAIGDPTIITSIQNDTTMPWLDTDISGETIRQRLIDRLS